MESQSIDFRVFDQFDEESLNGVRSFVLVYSVTDRDSFEAIKELHRLVIALGSVNIVLVATKCDDELNRVVSREEGEQLAASWGVTFFETSAIEDLNVVEVVDYLLQIAPDQPIAIVGSRGVGKRTFVSRYNELTKPLDLDTTGEEEDQPATMPGSDELVLASVSEQREAEPTSSIDIYEAPSRASEGRRSQRDEKQKSKQPAAVSRKKKEQKETVPSAKSLKSVTPTPSPTSLSLSSSSFDSIVSAPTAPSAPTSLSKMMGPTPQRMSELSVPARPTPPPTVPFTAPPPPFMPTSPLPGPPPPRPAMPVVPPPPGPAMQVSPPPPGPQAQAQVSPPPPGPQAQAQVVVVPPPSAPSFQAQPEVSPVESPRREMPKPSPKEAPKKPIDAPSEEKKDEREKDHKRVEEDITALLKEQEERLDNLERIDSIDQQVEETKKPKKPKKPKKKGRSKADVEQGGFIGLEVIIVLEILLIAMSQSNALAHRDQQNLQYNLFRCMGFCYIGKVGFVMLPIIFIMVFFLQVFIILPYLFVLLILYTTVIETDTVLMTARAAILDKESILKKAYRVFKVVMMCMPMTLLLVGYPIFIINYIIPTYAVGDKSKMVAFLAIGSHLLIIVGLQVFSIVRHYHSFELADEKQALKRWQINWRNYKNWIIIFGLLFELAQVVSLPIKFHPHLGVKEKLEPLFFEVQSYPNSIPHALDVSFWVSCGIVILLLLTYSFQFTMDLSAMWKSSAGSPEEKAQGREKFFFSMGGALVYGHNMLKEPAKTGTLISVLTDSLLICVCNNLLNILACNYDHGDPYLIINDSVVCWSGDHLWKATISLILFSYYLPLSIMVSPMLTEAGESEDNKDIKFKTAYIMMISLFKTLIFVVPIFFEKSDYSYLVLICLNDIASVLVTVLWTTFKSRRKSVYTFLTQPCTIPIINIWRSLPFVAGALNGMTALLGITFWLTGYGLIIAVMIMGLWTALFEYRERKLEKKIAKHKSEQETVIELQAVV